MMGLVSFQEEETRVDALSVSAGWGHIEKPASLEEGSHQAPNQPASWPWTPSPQNLEK